MAIDRRQSPERRVVVAIQGVPELVTMTWSKGLKNFAGKLPSKKGRKITEHDIIHEVKCWPSYYKPIVAGDKPFDVRKGNDRQYEAGHYLDLQEWDPDTKAFTGFHSLRKITYVMHGAPFLPEDTWVLGLSRECDNP